MISKRCWFALTLWVFGSAHALASCEESSRSSTPGGQEFFVICQSHDADPVKYVLTKFISDDAVYGVLSFRAGRQGFYCASEDGQRPVCHASNFGLIPAGDFGSARGYDWVINELAAIEPVSRPELSHPRDNRIDSSTQCYVAVKDKTITLGIRRDDPYGLERCLVALGRLRR